MPSHFPVHVPTNPVAAFVVAGAVVRGIAGCTDESTATVGRDGTFDRQLRNANAPMAMSTTSTPATTSHRRLPRSVSAIRPGVVSRRDAMAQENLGGRKLQKASFKLLYFPLAVCLGFGA